MAQVTVRFLGTGDAFGTGGRFHTCFYVRAAGARFLIDCGASAPVALKRFGVETSDLDFVVLSHLHGDHFGGLPFIVLDAQLVAKRTRPLLVAGPPGTRARLTEAMDVLFPESSRMPLSFPLEVRELEPERRQPLDGVDVTPCLVDHPSGAPAFALRIECGGRVIAYSGDSAWTEGLARAARRADLFIAEAYTFEKTLRMHMISRPLPPTWIGSPPGGSSSPT
jgi:ribonuclease BN (tRNA processing enzyme)